MPFESQSQRLFMTLKAFLKLVLPPFVLEIYRALRRAASPSADRFVCAPHGWNTKLPAARGRGYESAGVIAFYRDGWAPFVKALQNTHTKLVTDLGPDPDSWRMACEHNGFMTFGYVLALAAQRKDALKVLDYGGSLGTFYFIGRALIPDVPLEYHCKELPEMARAGQEMSSEIIWHTDDSCFGERYDLVMFSGSLQYVRDWQEALRKASRATRAYLYLWAVPVVERVGTYVAVQRHAGALILCQQFNKAELLATIDGTGLRLIREFWLEDHPHIANAPEQPSFYGCLLKRE